MFGRSKEEAPRSRTSQKALNRMRKLSEHEILNWADQVGTAVAMCLNDYRRMGEPASLIDAKASVEALSAAIEALSERQVG